MDRKVLGALTVTCFAIAAPLAFGQERESISISTSPAEISELKAQLKQQQEEIEQLKKLMADQRSLLESLAKPVVAERPASADRPAPPNLGQVASTTPMIPTPPPTPGPVAIPHQAPPKPADQPSPLQIPIGSTTITPVGFMDLTNTFR